MFDGAARTSVKNNNFQALFCSENIALLHNREPN